MRIRTAAITYITAVAVLVAAGSGALAWREWSRVSEVENVTKLMRVFGAASRFVEALALERGVYNQVIVATNMTAEAKGRLVADRVAFTGRRHFRRAVEGIEGRCGIDKASNR
jgi:hypothetical protein